MKVHRLRDNTKRSSGFVNSNSMHIGILALIIIISTLILANSNQKSAKETIRFLNRFYLEELTERIENEINRALDDYSKQLEHMAGAMQTEKFESDEELEKYLVKMQRMYDVDMFAVVDDKGHIYHVEDAAYEELAADLFSKTKTMMEPKLFTLETKQAKEMVFAAMTISDMRYKDTRIVGCMTGVELEQLISVQQLQGNDRQVMYRLFDGQDGRCLLETEKRYADGGSIFDVWREECDFLGEQNCEQLISDWQNQEAGYICYYAKEGYTYLDYKPIKRTTWMVSARLREGLVGTQVNNVTKRALIGNWIQVFVIVLSTIVVLVLMMKQMRKAQMIQFEKEMEEELSSREAKASEEKIRLQEKLLAEEKASNRQASVLQILSQEYTSVFYINIEKDAAVPIRLNDLEADRYGLKKNCHCPFKSVFEQYVKDYVLPEYVEEIFRFTDAAYLRERMKETGIVTYRYQILREGENIYAQLRMARVEKEADFKHMVLGLAIIDDEIRLQQEQERMLKEALTQAELASRAKTIFLNNMSHDIRTPMNAIIGFTNIALKQENSEEVRGYLENIRESSEHLLTLINDVLDISRIESGKVQYRPVPINVMSVTDMVVDIVNGFLQNRNIHFEVNIKRPENPYALADAVRIREVLVNILSNAVKFTDDGGTITFDAIPCPLEDPQHGIMRYRISDTGIGMSAEFKEHIFDEFAQEESSARTHYKGTGLGMSITKHYVEMMGGTISVESTKGVGTTFTVELPLDLVDQEAVEEKTKTGTKQSLKGVKVLMAEDNDLNAEIAMIQLEELGMKIERTCNGKETVDAFLNHPAGTYDVILMDIMMPVLDGYETTKVIRSLKARPDGRTIPIIAMTANAFAEDVQHSLDVGMNAHLSKPIVIEQVTKVIFENLNH